MGRAGGVRFAFSFSLVRTKAGPTSLLGGARMRESPAALILEFVPEGVEV